MNPQLFQDSLEEYRARHIAEHLLGSLFWYFIMFLVVTAVVTFVKIYYGRKITLWLDGKFWHSHRNFDYDDAILIDDKLCRLVRATSTDTVFYEYTLDDDGRVIFADRRVVSNDKLCDLKITKQIPSHVRPDTLKPVKG